MRELSLYDCCRVAAGGFYPTLPCVPLTLLRRFHGGVVTARAETRHSLAKRAFFSRRVNPPQVVLDTCVDGLLSPELYENARVFKCSRMLGDGTTGKQAPQRRVHR